MQRIVPDKAKNGFLSRHEDVMGLIGVRVQLPRLTTEVRWRKT